MIRYGLIGAGGVGQKRAASLQPGQLLGVYDIDEKPDATWPGLIAKSADQIFSNPKIDAIIVSTRHDTLAFYTLRAMQAGKHVLVEKPAARNASELKPLLEAEAKCGVRVRVGYNHRFHPGMQAARRIVDSGALGSLMFIRGRYGHGGRLGYEKEWRADRKLSGGGELIDQGVHLIDLARWFLGNFTEIHGRVQTLFWKMKVEDNAFLELATANGGVAWLHASCTEWKNLFSLEIFGSAGKLQVDGLGGSYGLEKIAHYRMRPEMGPPDIETKEFPGVDDSWRAEILAFEQDIATGRTPSCGLADAYAALCIVDEIYRQNGLA